MFQTAINVVFMFEIYTDTEYRLDVLRATNGEHIEMY